MDKQTSSNALSSVRTFAKDMAKKQALSESVRESEVSQTTQPNKAIPRPETKEEPRIYQAPSWTGNKNQPAKKPEPEIKAEKPSPKKTEIEEPPKEIEQTLKPLSAPKKEGETIIVASENTRPGVIITDTKHNRFRLFPAIFASISQWFSDLRQKQVASKIPKYTVPETSHRKGVIQKATSKTGKFTSADALSIHERIRLRKERATPKTPTTIWTANTEPGFPLLEPGETKISNVKVVLKKSFQNISKPTVAKEELPEPWITTAEIPEVVMNIKDTVEEVVAPVAVKYVEPEVIKPVVTEPIVVAKPPVVVATPAPVYVAPVVPIVEPVVEKEPAPEIREEKVTQLKPAGLKEWIFNSNINTLSISVSGVVLGIVIISFGSYFWINNKISNEVESPSASYQTLIEGPLQLIYPKTLTRAGLFEDVINSYKTTEGDVAQQIFVASEDRATLLKPETITQTLNLPLEPAFTKSISYIYFGGLRKSVPFILLDITDYTTVRGGMLNWETTIYSDLSPLFNYNQLHDLGSIKTAIFTDVVIKSNDVRILRTLSGEELLVYGLINRDTVIITTNSTAFVEITNLIK